RNFASGVSGSALYCGLRAESSRPPDVVSGIAGSSKEAAAPSPPILSRPACADHWVLTVPRFRNSEQQTHTGTRRGQFSRSLPRRLATLSRNTRDIHPLLSPWPGPRDAPPRGPPEGKLTRPPSRRASVRRLNCERRR